MPSAPNIDGWPFWAQLLITAIIGLGTLFAAFRGYFLKDSSKAAEAPSTAAVLSATIADMGAIRHLSDVCIRLSGSTDKLTDAIEELTHYERMRYELERETCARLRELREAIERRPI